MPPTFLRRARTSVPPALVIPVLVLSALFALPGCVVVVDSDDEWSDEDGVRVQSLSEVGDGPYIGVHTGSASKTLGEQLGLDASKVTVVTSVVEGSPADHAGLRRHDVIAAIDGNEAADPGDLRAAIRARTPGETLILRVYRAGQPLEIPVQVGERD